MLVLERILAIPEQSIDYLQMGISGGERAALKERGFVRKDGTKAKDYMIRTIEKTEKNKGKAEKAIIKGDKPLTQKKPAYLLTKADFEKRVESGDPHAFSNTTEIDYGRLPRGQGKRVGGMVMGAMGSGGLQGKKTYVNTVGKLPDAERSEIAVLERHAQVGYAKARSAGFSHDEAALSAYALDEGESPHEWHVERALRTGQKVPSEVLKDYPDLIKQYSKSSKIAPDTVKKLAVTDKKGFQSEGSAAKKIKGAIAGVKGGKVVKGVSPRDRDLAVIKNDAWGKKELNNKRREYTSKSTDIPQAYSGYSLPKSTLRELSSASQKIVDGQSINKAVKGIPDAKTRRTVKQILEKDIDKIAKQTKFRIATQKASQKDTAIAPNTSKNSEAIKKRSPLNIKDALNKQLSKKVESKKSQGFKVSPKAMIEAQKYSVANQALTNISTNTKRLRQISTGTAKKRTITDSLGNSFTRKKYRFKQPSATAKKLNISAEQESKILKSLRR